MKISASWMMGIFAGLLVLLQGVILHFTAAPFYVEFAALSLSAFILFIVIWAESRAKARHGQLLQRIARASTRREINDLKWQLDKRDSTHLKLLISEIHALEKQWTTNLDDSQNSVLHDLQSSIDLEQPFTRLSSQLNSINLQIQSNSTSYQQLPGLVEQVNTIEHRVQTILQQVHELRTAPKYARSAGHIEQIRHGQSSLTAEIQAIRNLLIETVIHSDSELI